MFKPVFIGYKYIDEIIIIRNGATSVEAVKEATSATDGACRGARCKSKVQELIDQHK